jgi:uncharacterized protein DUF6882
MTDEQFKEFRHQAVHQLMALNKACDEQFHYKSLPRWQYELDARTLTFLDDNVPKVVASIEAVGSSSKSGKTWMWAWANDSLPSPVKEAVSTVRDFGEAEGIDVLTKPCSPDDEYLGWEMTAIAAKLLGSVGAYRCPGDNGFIYFVFSEIHFANSEQGSALLREQVTCPAHDSGFTTYVCEHLVANPVQQWFSSKPDETDRWPDAWCSVCDGFFQEQGEWNEQNEKKMKINVLCHHCYELNRAQASRKT